jgi:cation transport protein ChaC
MLTRENILNGVIRAMLSEVGGIRHIHSDEELQASRRELLAAAQPGADVWMFGYGSLIWNPAFHFVERRVGTAHGYHRRFCLWSHIGRGTADNPGLVLGLDRGGSCRGVAYRVAADVVESELDVLWRREMIGGAYIARWLTVRTADGPVRAIAFTINRDHSRYAGRLEPETIADAIASAMGPLGPCADYLINTVAHLEELGIADPRLRALYDRVMALGGPGSPSVAGS